jgi:hypothetical protein
MLTVIGLLVAAVIGLQGVTAVHMARLRHTALAVPLITVAGTGTLGLIMLVRAYRRARNV